MSPGLYIIIFLSILFLLGTSCLIIDSFKPKKIIIKKEYKSNYKTYEDNPLCDLVYFSKKFESDKNIYAKVQTGKEFKSEGYKKTINIQTFFKYI